MTQISRTDDIIMEISKYQGKQLKLLRKSYGLSQQQLGEVMGVSLQQVQKYEKGLNRLSAARLCMLAEKIKKGGDPKFDIKYFFEGINFKYFENHIGNVLLPAGFTSFLDRIIPMKRVYENIIINLVQIKDPKKINIIQTLISKFIKLETFEGKQHESIVEKGDEVL